MYKQLSVLFTIILCITSGSVHALNYVESKNLLSLLEQEDFTRLESTLNSYFDAYEKDNKEESNVDQALEALNSNYEWMPDTISKWKQHSPDSYLPDLSLALYHNKMGWESRGQKIMDETTKKQVDKMQFHFNNAKLNFNRALNKKPDLLHAYAYLVNIAMTSRNNTEATRYYQQGLGINMYSKRMHLFYSFALLPRWGGSMEQLEKFSELMTMLSKDNPQLKSLIGVEDTEAGDQFFYAGKPAEALLHYLRAEKNGATWYLHMNMGDAYRQKGLYDDAKTHYQELISLRPMYAPAYYKLAQVLMLQNHHREAMDVGKIALEIDPDEYDYITQQAQLYFNLDDYDNALKYVTIAKELNPDDNRLTMFTSIIEMKQKNTKN